MTTVMGDIRQDRIEQTLDRAVGHQFVALAFSEGTVAASVSLAITDNPYEEDDQRQWEAREYWFAGYLLLRPETAFDLGKAAGLAKAQTGSYEPSPFFDDCGIGAQDWMEGYDQGHSSIEVLNSALANS